MSMESAIFLMIRWSGKFFRSDNYDTKYNTMSKNLVCHGLVYTVRGHKEASVYVDPPPSVLIRTINLHSAPLY